MQPKSEPPRTMDEYIAEHPGDVREKLERIREAIRKAAPGAEETISYRMPAFRLHGVLVYFAAFKKHIGFFPTASGVEEFKSELSAYDTSKGTIRFPLDQPIPYKLIGEIVAFRVQENLEKAKAGKKKRW